MGIRKTLDLPPEKQYIFLIAFLHFLKALIPKQSVHHGHWQTLNHNQSSASEDKARVGEGGLLLLYHFDANDPGQNSLYPGCYYYCVSQAKLYDENKFKVTEGNKKQEKEKKQEKHFSVKCN